MLIEKLTHGVLRVLTPLGPRYIRPTFKQRLALLWIFRNFDLLPLQVLSKSQRQLIDELAVEQQFVSIAQDGGIEDEPILGTIEKRPPVEVENPSEKRPNARAAAAPAGGVHQRL
jgi:hypothetical protein